MRAMRMLMPGLLFVSLTGCVLGTRNIDITPPDYANDITASGDVHIAAVTDDRHFEAAPRDPSVPSVDGDLGSTSEAQLAALIGRQRNSYGAAIGGIALPQGMTVMDEMQELLTEGIESRGYRVVAEGGAPNTLEVSILEFWAWATPGFATMGFEAKISSRITLTTPKGREEFTVKGYGSNRGGMASDANWVLAYERAYQDFLKNLDAVMDAAGY